MPIIGMIFELGPQKQNSKFNVLYGDILIFPSQSSTYIIRKCPITETLDITFIEVFFHVADIY